MLERLGWSLARALGLIFVLLGTWVVVINSIERSYSAATLAWILVAGVLGATGGVVYLLGIDGSRRWRRRRVRAFGWAGMLTLAVLPSSLSLFLLPMLLLALPTLLLERLPTAEGTPGLSC
jgi:hypothetical protein